MAEDISDAQVLAQLYRRKAKLSIELEKVNTAIKAFEDVDENSLDELDIAPYTVEEITDELAIATLMYNPKSTAEKKIQFALSKIGKGDATQITQYLLRIDNSTKDEKKLHDRVTYVASRMYKAGKLDAEKIGKKNIYKKKTE